MKGVILTAGRGTRIMPATADRPKTLLDLGGVTLLERMAWQCEQVGLAGVVLVVGHRAEAIERWAARRSWRVPHELVFNPRYADWNNGYSLLVAREALGGAGFVKFDGDLLLHTASLRRLLEAPCESALVVDRGATLADEEMKVQLAPAGGRSLARVTALGKWLAADTCQGETIGVEKIGAADAERVFAALQQLVVDEGASDAYYEDAYHRLVGQGWRLCAVETGDDPWTEIDTAEDLAHARELLPRMDHA